MSDDPTLELFVALSSALTGYDLSAMPDQMDLAPAYLARVESFDGHGLAALVAGWKAAVADAGGADADPLDPGALDEDALRDSVARHVFDADPPLPALARRILRLWYLSFWYEEEPPPIGAWPDIYPDGSVFSAASYSHGLAFRVARAHPPGDSAVSGSRYGMWSDPPPPDDGPPPMATGVESGSADGDGRAS